MNENNSGRIIRTASAEAAGASRTRSVRNLLPKILCVLAAFVLWLYVMQVESPEYEHEITSVSVELVNGNTLNSESGLAVYSGSGKSINVTVAGKKSIVTKLTAEDVKAYIDLSNVKEAGRHSLEVSVDLPEDVVLAASEPSTVTLYVDETDSVSLPVSEKLVNFVLESPYELGELDFEFDTVNVTGPKNKINDLAGAVVTVNMEGRKASFVTGADIALVDKLGNLVDMNYLNLSATQMNVTVPIYMTREVPVEVRFKHGLVDASLVNVTVDPPTVLLRGDAAKFADGAPLIEKIELDEKTITETPYTEMRDISIREGLTNLSETTEVRVTVEYDRSVRTREISVSDIKVTGAHADMEYEVLAENVLVVLRGVSSELDSLKTSNVNVAVDIEGFDPSSSGIITKYATVEVNAKNADSVFIIGTYPVQIKINQNEK